MSERVLPCLVLTFTAGAESIVDVATLTGAIIVGLGPEVAGMFTPNEEMAASLTAAAKASGEQFWRMPMQNSYWASCGMKSDYADMKNTGSRGGGAITAALFLKQFIEKEDVKWAHLDIAVSHRVNRSSRRSHGWPATSHCFVAKVKPLTR